MPLSIRAFVTLFQGVGGIPVKEEKRRKPFDGAAWFDRQVSIRTRAALDERGSTAKSSSREYKIEYARQVKLFRAERASLSRRKKKSILRDARSI